MATATSKNTVLVLTQEETEFLSVLLGKIGGWPKTSSRQYSDSILAALESQGHSGNRYYHKYPMSGTIRCEKINDKGNNING